MSLLEDMRMMVRTASTKTDTELDMWIDGAFAELSRVGIPAKRPADDAAIHPLVKQFIAAHVRSKYGLDSAEEQAAWAETAEKLERDMMNSPSVWGSSDGQVL